MNKKEENNKKMIDNLSKLIVEQREYYESIYPTDIPNSKCNYALLTGLKFENSFGPKVNDVYKLFETEYETVSVWTHSKNEYSALITEVSESIKDLNFWKNIGYVIQVSLDYYKSFELFTDIEYRWCYYFDRMSKYDSLELYNTNDLERFSMGDASIIKITELSEIARLLELFMRDEKAFTAVNQFYSSMKLHYCCLICERGESIYKHPSHEPEVWEQAAVISNYEPAIVQACRCVEALIGKPPKKDKSSRVLITKEKWIETLGINPDDNYKKTDITYFEYYYNLFEKRNFAAHSFGTIPFDLERKDAVLAQCFASEILDAYIYNNVISQEDALESLKFNTCILDRVSKNMSSSTTYDDDNKNDYLWEHIINMEKS